MDNLLQFVQNNFSHAGPIVALAGLAVIITLERLYALYLIYPMVGSASFFKRIKDLVMADKIEEAIVLCDRYGRKPTPLVMKAALVRAHQPDELIEQSLQIVVSEATQNVQKRTAYLATIANVATLLGLFGTIVGLTHSFEALGGASAQQRSALLSAGISTAMNATLLGLGVAIPCMLIFSFLASKSNSLVAEIERAAMNALETIKIRYYANDGEKIKRGA